MSNPSENVPQTLPLPSEGQEEKSSTPVTTAASPASSPPTVPVPPSTRREDPPTQALSSPPPAKPDRTEILPGPNSDSFGTQALSPSAAVQRPGEIAGTMPLSEAAAEA